MKKIDLSKISTEQRNKNTLNIDVASTIEIATLLNKEDMTVPKAINKVLPEIAKAIDLATLTIKKGGRMFYIGAGTSGRLGVLDASEMPPTYNVPNNWIIGLIAGGDIALRNPVEGAEDSLEGAEKDLKEYKFNKNDILVGIAASGRTPYVIGGMKFANKLGAKTISLSTSSNSEIGKLAKIKIEAVTGAEPITGSTRMKSGTAQKLILNMISTGTMVKLGKTFGNLMIDVKTSNEKLVERAIKIVSEVTKAERELIISTLKEADMNCKLASVMIVKKVSKDNAQKLLDKANGVLRKII